ncbi:MAG: type II toxin-antitoxin system HicB family antitoxin [Candidatus Binatia bacterium]
MKTVQYLVRINKDPDSDWGASVPDLPGCVATGKSIDAALRRIERAIELHLRGMREDGLKAPQPRQRAVIPRRTSRRVDFYATVQVVQPNPRLELTGLTNRGNREPLCGGSSGARR